MGEGPQHSSPLCDMLSCCHVAEAGVWCADLTPSDICLSLHFLGASCALAEKVEALYIVKILFE